LGAIRCGRLWTPVESKACRFGLCGRLWTPVDTAWRSTDQKGWGFEFSRACQRNPLEHGGFVAWRELSLERRGAVRAILGSHSRSICPGRGSNRLVLPGAVAFAAGDDDDFLTDNMGGHARTPPPLGSAE
jgi:hypothetical protein